MTNTITLPRSVVEQAISTILELEYSNSTAVSDKMARDSKAALRAALEQPQVEQKPVAWIEHEWSGSGLRHLHFERPAPTVRDEVVCPVWTPLYTHPQPPRQPLTDQQINDHRLALAYDSEDLPDPWDFKQGVRAAERAHGIGGEK